MKAFIFIAIAIAASDPAAGAQASDTNCAASSAPFFTTGSDNTLPLVIYARIRRVIDPGLNALATILLIGTTLLAVLAARSTTASGRR